MREMGVKRRAFRLFYGRWRHLQALYSASPIETCPGSGNEANKIQSESSNFQEIL